MTIVQHPCAKIQDTIDHLKTILTCPRGEASEYELAGIWNKLEDLIVMLVTPETILYTKKDIEELERKAKKWDRLTNFFKVQNELEHTDADTAQESRGDDQDRGGDQGDDHEHRERAGQSGDRCSEGSGSTPGRSVPGKAENS